MVNMGDLDGTLSTHATSVLSTLLPYLHTWQVLGCRMLIPLVPRTHAVMSAGMYFLYSNMLHPRAMCHIDLF